MINAFKYFEPGMRLLFFCLLVLVLLLGLSCTPYNNEYEKSLYDEFSILNNSNEEFSYFESSGLDTAYYISIHKLNPSEISKLKEFKERDDYKIDNISLVSRALSSLINSARVCEPKRYEKKRELLELCESQKNIIFFSRWPLSHLVDEKEPNWVLISGYVIMPDINSVANIQVEVSDDSKMTAEQKKRYLEHTKLLEEVLEKEGKLDSEGKSQLNLLQKKLEKEIESDKSNKLDKR